LRPSYLQLAELRLVWHNNFSRKCALNTSLKVFYVPFVATERHVNTLLQAAISSYNLSLKNGLEAYAMVRCLSHSNKHSRPDHMRILWLNNDATETEVIIWQAPKKTTSWRRRVL
jgi:hypothetical protein